MLNSIVSTPKTVLIYLIWVSVWIAIHVLVVLNTGFSLKIALIDSLVSNALLVAACYAIGNALRYYTPTTTRSFNLFIWALLITAGWLYAVNSILVYALASQTDFLTFLNQSLALRYGIAFLSIGCFILLNWTAAIIQQKQAEEQRKTTTEQLAKDAELALLRQQLHPHFLFNSLNSISALIVLRPDEARKMIQQLSDFLRGTIKKEEAQLVTLAEEWAHVELYLTIEKMRFGNRLHTETTFTEASKNAVLPPLLLQPLVENAIKFGLYDTLDAVIITASSTLENGYLVLIITNPYDARTTDAVKGTGFGLSSIARRLYLLYGRKDLLHTQTTSDTFITTVKIPQNTLL